MSSDTKTCERTTLDVAAETVAMLLHRGVIPAHRKSEAAAAAGLMEGDVSQANVRIHERGFIAPRREVAQAVSSEADPMPVVDAPEYRDPESIPEQARPGALAKRRKRNELNQLRCGGPELFGWIPCRQWKDESAFLPRTDRPGGFRTMCTECFREYQKLRRLDTAKLEALSKASVTFFLLKDDDMVGVLCTDCNEPLVADDWVAVRGDAYHIHCVPLH